MSDSTRRGFIALVGTGAATVATAAAAPAAFADGARDGADNREISSRQPLVAHVTDPRSGKVSIMVGETEVVVHDRDLVARLVHASGR